MNQSYSELLRDPRWQKKRLYVMERDGFACRNCKDGKSTLNVHHCYYEKGRKPWDYPDVSLLTLCEDCHMLQRQIENEAEQKFLEMLRRLGVCGSDFDGFVASLIPCLVHRTVPIGHEVEAALTAISMRAMEQAKEATPP